MLEKLQSGKYHAIADLEEKAAAKLQRLNDEQRAMHGAVVDLLMNFNPKEGKLMIRMIGYAGTGKTFTLNRIVESCVLRDSSMVFAMTAPTNKAVRVLRKNCENPDFFEFGTIHSLLGLEQRINDFTGEVTYEAEYASMRSKIIRLDECDALVVDESSMLDPVLFSKLLVYLQRRNIPVLFVGDDAQIPPVGFKSSPVFSEHSVQEHNMLTYYLTRIMRQGEGSEIIQYATFIRQNLRYLTHNQFNIDPSMKALQILPKDRSSYPIIKELFTSNEFRNDPDYCKVLAYRNVEVRKFNTLIRQFYHGEENLPKVVEGDLLVADSPILGPQNSSGLKSILVSKSEEMEVTRCKVISREYSYQDFQDDKSTETTIKTVSITSYQTEVTISDISSNKFRSQIINIVHESDEGYLMALKNNLADKIKKSCPPALRKTMWKSLFQLRDCFADVTHNYAITVHKSQGSTYTHCISNEWDIQNNSEVEERNRIKYVAATRAKETLFLVR